MSSIFRAPVEDHRPTIRHVPPGPTAAMVAEQWGGLRTLFVLGALDDLSKGDKQPEPLIYATFVDQTTIEQVIAGARGRATLTEIESKRLLEAAGIATAMAEHARTADEAAAAAVRAGLPAVVKVLSPD